jgi:hypothetical protein
LLPHILWENAVYISAVDTTEELLLNFQNGYRGVWDIPGISQRISESMCPLSQACVI